MTNFITLNDLLILSGKYETNIDNFYNAFLGEFNKLFNGSELNPYKALTNLNTYFAQPIDLLKYLITKYGDRCFGEKFVYHEYIPQITTDQYGHITNIQMVYATEQDAYEAIKSYLIAAMNSWLASNKLRYLRIIGAMELNYNPIENYDKTEDTTRAISGDHTNERKYDRTTSPYSVEVTTPITDVGVDSDLNLSAVTPVEKIDVFTKGEGASTGDEQLSKKSGTGPSITDTTDPLTKIRSMSITGDTPAAGSIPTTENQVTTYDSDTYHNNNKTTNNGDKANTSKNAGYTATEDRGHAVLRKDRIEADYTDTESWNKYDDSINVRGHGNIGVTTTQQLLEQELALRSKPVIHNIIDDVMDQLMLHVWE